MLALAGVAVPGQASRLCTLVVEGVPLAVVKHKAIRDTAACQLLQHLLLSPVNGNRQCPLAVPAAVGRREWRVQVVFAASLSGGARSRGVLTAVCEAELPVGMCRRRRGWHGPRDARRPCCSWSRVGCWLAATLPQFGGGQGGPVPCVGIRIDVVNQVVLKVATSGHGSEVPVVCAIVGPALDATDLRGVEVAQQVNTSQTANMWNNKSINAIDA